MPSSSGRIASSRGGTPSSHPDPDLAPLCLDDSGRQVEGGEGGTGEDQDGKDVEHLLVAAGVLVEDAVGGVVGQHRHFAAEAGAGEGALQLAAHGGHAGPVAQSHHGVVDLRRAAGDPLCRPQRGEDDCELRLGAAEFAAARAGDDEVLGRAADADIAEALAAGQAQHALWRQVVVGGEATLEHGDGTAFVAGTQGAPGLGVDPIDRGSVGPERRADDFGRDEQRFLAGPRHLDLGRQAQALRGRLHLAGGGDPADQPRE